MASLEMVELMVRCEARFEVELPEHMAEEAETPAGWVKAILEGGRDAETKAAYRISPPRLDAISEPTSATSLIDVLALEFASDSVDLLFAGQSGNVDAPSRYRVDGVILQ